MSSKYDAYIESQNRLGELVPGAGVPETIAQRLHDERSIPTEEMTAIVNTFANKGIVGSHFKKYLITAMKEHRIFRECRCCEDVACYGHGTHNVFPTHHNPTLCFAHAKEFERESWKIWDSRAQVEETCDCCGKKWNWFGVVGPRGGVHRVNQARMPEYDRTKQKSEHSVAKFYTSLPGGKGAHLLCGKCHSALINRKDNDFTVEHFTKHLEDTTGRDEWQIKSWKDHLAQAKRQISRCDEVRKWIKELV